MKKAVHIQYLADKISALEIRLEADKKRLETGSPREKVDAAGDLVVVERRLADARTKLNKAEKEGEGLWESLSAELDEDIGFVENAISSWTQKYGGV